MKYYTQLIPLFIVVIESCVHSFVSAAPNPMQKNCANNKNHLYHEG